MLQDFDDGLCDAALLFRDAWKNAQVGKLATRQNDGSSAELNHCDKTSVGGSVMSIPNVRGDHAYFGCYSTQGGMQTPEI